MKITLTGSSGFIGSHLKKVLESEHQVQVIKHEFKQSQIDAALESFKPDIVVHLGSLFIASHESKDIEPLILSNILWSTWLAEACVKHKVPSFINAGSSWQSWENSTVPVTLYAATKTSFESILSYYSSCFGLKVMNLWLFDSFGFNDKRGKLMSKLTEVFKTGQELALSPGDQWLNLVHVDDICLGFSLAVKQIAELKPSSFVNYELSNPEEIRLKHLVQLFEEVAKTKSPVRLGGRPYRQREVMKPSHPWPRLPGWTPLVTLGVGIQGLLNEK